VFKSKTFFSKFFCHKEIEKIRTTPRLLIKNNHSYPKLPTQDASNIILANF
jgi:hypothetical protein